MPSKLSSDQVAQFHKQGFLGPFEAMPAAEMNKLRGEITTLLQTSPEPYPEEGWHARLIPRHHNQLLDSALAHPARNGGEDEQYCWRTPPALASQFLTRARVLKQSLGIRITATGLWIIGVGVKLQYLGSG